MVSITANILPLIQCAYCATCWTGHTDCANQVRCELWGLCFKSDFATLKISKLRNPKVHSKFVVNCNRVAQYGSCSNLYMNKVCFCSLSWVPNYIEYPKIPQTLIKWKSLLRVIDLALEEALELFCNCSKNIIFFLFIAINKH